MAASRDGPFAVSPNHDGNFNTATQKGVADRQTIEDPPRKDRNRKARTPPRISPPPLKRQRTDPGNRRSSPHAPAESLGRSFPTSSRLAEIANNISGLLRPSPSVGSRGFASLENPLATLSNAIRWTTSLRTRENDEISSSSCIARSERSNGSGPVVPICRLCHKKINKGFDPVIRCSSCQRPYHEACGKPPLVPGESWDTWACLKCTTGIRKPGLSGIEHLPPKNFSRELSDEGNRRNISATLNRSENGLSSTVKDLVSIEATLDAREGKPTFSTPRNIPCQNTVNRLAPATIDTSELLSSLQDDALDRLVVEPLPTSGKPNSRIRRTEIPDTPQQRSSQLNIESTAPKSSDVQASVPSGLQAVDESTLNIEPSQQGKRKTFTTLCQVCKKEPALVGSSSKIVKCVRCKNRAELMEQYHITIPETPVSMLSRSNSAEASRPPFPVPGSNDGGPASGTNLDAKNKRWDKPRSPATASCSPAQQRRSVTYEILSKSSSAEASSPPPPVSSSDEGSPASSANRDAKTKRIAEPPSLGQQKRQSSESRSPTGSETLLRSGLRSKSEEVARVFITSDRAAEEQSAASGTLDTSAIDQAYNLESNHHELEDTDDEESAAGERPGAWRLQPTRDQKATNTDSLAPNMTVRLDSSRFKPKAGQYNNRQLAGMALLAAGRPCSALQVQNWVAENFPGYRKGKGAWERSLQASLAGRDDFRAIVSLGDRFRLYYFAHPASRKPYEELFSDYTANETASEERPTETPPVRTVTAITPEASIAAQSDVLRDVTIEGATGITTTEPPGDKPSNGSGNSTGPELPILAPPGESTLAASHLTYLGVLSISEENISHDFDGIFMPFERADMFHPIEDRDPPGTRREASFSKAFPELARPSIATMSDADIKKKIEEIKSRPSRKAKWGKRLAFARLHRQDVHDETDGAWKPRFPVETRHQNAEDGDDDVQDSAENLKDIFDMPKNPILILHNDQLAFRDGTLINGKLPRSRVVYKVGRKFGGENGDLRL